MVISTKRRTNAGENAPVTKKARTGQAPFKRQIPLIKATPQNFAPFGTILGDTEATGRSSTHYKSVRVCTPSPNFECDDADACVIVLCYEPRPVEVKYLERHYKHTQTFIPLEGKGLIGFFAPPNDNDEPDLDDVVALRFDGSAGFVLHKGTWHEQPFPEEPHTKAICFLRNETCRELAPTDPATGECHGEDICKLNIVARHNIVFTLKEAGGVKKEGGGASSGNCKWCAMGDCWSHGVKGGGAGKGGASDCGAMGPRPVQKVTVGRNIAQLKHAEPDLASVGSLASEEDFASLLQMVESGSLSEEQLQEILASDNPGEGVAGMSAKANAKGMQGRIAQNTLQLRNETAAKKGGKASNAGGKGCKKGGGFAGVSKEACKWCQQGECWTHKDEQLNEIPQLDIPGGAMGSWPAQRVTVGRNIAQTKHAEPDLGSVLSLASEEDFASLLQLVESGSLSEEQLQEILASDNPGEGVAGMSSKGNAKGMQGRIAQNMGGGKASKAGGKGGKKGGGIAGVSKEECKWCQQGECWTHKD